jgi:hypothetical protein
VPITSCECSEKHRNQQKGNYQLPFNGACVPIGIYAKSLLNPIAPQERDNRQNGDDGGKGPNPHN